MVITVDLNIPCYQVNKAQSLTDISTAHNTT